MKQNKHVLSQKLRKAALNKKATKHTKKLNDKSARFPQVTSDHRPTYAGMHRSLWESICYDRKWEKTTAKSYETAADNVVLPAFDHSKAFEDLTEEDVFAAWDRIIASGCSNDSVQKASRIIRETFDLAYIKGWCQLTLWGVPLPETKEREKGNRTPTDKSKAKGAALAKEVFQPRSFPLDVELKLVNLLMKSANNYGELVAALIMLCTGARTSEACGLTFKRFQRMADDYWALVRVDTLSSSSRKIEGLTGKTENSYRYLFVPPFLARFLLERKSQLEQLYPHQNIDEFPISCKGREYKKGCTQKELNKMLKLVYQKAGLDEKTMLHAYNTIRKNQDEAKDAELIATAYLCRKHFATTAIACGLTTEEICIAMGHDIPTTRIQAYDAANPEYFRKIADKLRRWPLVHIMDNRADTISYDLGSNRSQQFIGDLPIELHLPKGCSFHLDADAIAPNDRIVVKKTDIQQPYYRECWLPEVTEQTTHLSPKQFLLEQSRRVWNQMSDDLQSIIEIPASTTRKYNWLEKLNASAPRKKEDDLEFDSSNAAPEYAVSYIPLYAVYTNGLIKESVEPQPIRNLSTVGVSMVKKDNPQLCRMLVHDSGKDALVITPSGTAFKLPKGTHIDSADFCTSDNPAYQALLSSGILLQGDALKNPTGTIVCIMNSGRVRRISTKRLQRFSDAGRQLLALSDNEYIADACLCDESQDILLVTEQGQALRVRNDDLLAVSTIGSAPYTGIALDIPDKAIACTPYTEGSEYMIVKRSGLLSRTSNDFKISAHGRGGKGIKFADVDPDDKIIRVIPYSNALLLISATHSLCISTDEVRSTKGACKGVRSMSLKPDKYLLDAIPLQFYEEQI